MYRATAKKVFWEFDSIIVQNLSDILPMFCAPTCRPHHVSATQELGTKLSFHLPSSQLLIAPTVEQCAAQSHRAGAYLPFKPRIFFSWTSLHNCIFKARFKRRISAASNSIICIICGRSSTFERIKYGSLNLCRQKIQVRPRQQRVTTQIRHGFKRRSCAASNVTHTL